MELLDDFDSLPEPIVIQPIEELSSFATVEEEGEGAISDIAGTDTREAYSDAAATETSTGDAYSVMLDHAYAVHNGGMEEQIIIANTYKI